MYSVESWTNKHSQPLYCAIRQQWLNHRACKTGILVSPIYNGCLFMHIHMYTFVCLRQHWCFNPGIPWDYILATLTIIRPITAHFTSSQWPPLCVRITVASTVNLTWSLLITNKDQVHANFYTNRNQLYSVSYVIFLMSVFEFMCCSFLLRKKLPLPSPSTPTPPPRIQYIPRNMHTVLLCFALLWLCNRS